MNVESYVESNPAVSSIHIIWGPIALLFIIVAGFFKDFIGLLPPCIFHKLTGIPCLTCGATRSLVALSQFDIISSFLLNPLLIIFAAGIMAVSLFSLFSAVSRQGIIVNFSEGQKKAFRIGLICLIIINWVFLIATGR